MSEKHNKNENNPIQEGYQPIKKGYQPESGFLDRNNPPGNQSDSSPNNTNTINIADTNTVVDDNKTK